MQNVVVRFLLANCLWVLFSCTSSRKLSLNTIQKLRFVGEYTLPADVKFKGTTVGGLSGIDYDPERNLYYLICDDRADTNYVRYYTAKISVAGDGIRNVEMTGVTKLLKSDGQPFHNRRQNPHDVPDPEAIRFHPPTQTLYWSSEGERTIKNGKTVLTNPAVYIAKPGGAWVDTLPLPANVRMSASETGPRNNGVFEGLAFSPDYQKLFVSIEEPLYEDGPRAGLFDSSAWVRILKYDVNGRQPEAQFAYQIDPVAQEPISEGLFVVNGITDILAINDHQLLVTERSFSTGRLGNHIMVYLAESNGAEDVSAIRSLSSGPAFKPVRKIPLLNMSRLGRLIDNIEGATFGPKLPNGKQSLLFVADNNFSPRQKNQLLLFEAE